MADNEGNNATHLGEEGTPPAGPEMVQVPKEQFAEIQKRLDVYDKHFLTPQAPAAPAAPAGPTVGEQLQELDGQIAEVGKEIDGALSEGKPVSSLMAKRDELNRRRTTLEITSQHIDPILSSGINTIEQLTTEVVKDKMPHLAVPVVKAEFDRLVTSLTPEQRMHPTMRMQAYNLAVGNNLDVIVNTQKEVWLRESTPPGGQIPGDKSGRQGDPSAPKIPKPAEILNRENLDALERAGRTVDQHYQSLGYEGWDDYWTKTGAEYFGYEGGEQ